MEKAIHVNRIMSIPAPLTEIKTFYQWEVYKVETETDAELAGQVLKTIKDRLKEIEAHRKNVVGPIKKGITAFETLCRETTDPLKKVDRILRSRVEGFWTARQKKLEEEARQKREEEIAENKRKQEESMNLAMETGSETAAQEAEQRSKNIERLESKEVAVSQTVKTRDFTMAQTKRFVWKITDEKMIPKEFFILDEKKLNSIAKSYKKNRVEIPGIEFVEEIKTSIR